MRHSSKMRVLTCVAVALALITITSCTNAHTEPTVHPTARTSTSEPLSSNETSSVMQAPDPLRACDHISPSDAEAALGRTPVRPPVVRQTALPSGGSSVICLFETGAARSVAISTNRYDSRARFDQFLSSESELGHSVRPVSGLGEEAAQIDAADLLVFTGTTRLVVSVRMAQTADALLPIERGLAAEALAGL